MSKKIIIPHNTDKDGCVRCLMSNYYKMGVEDFIGGGGKYDKRATCVIEIYEYRQDNMPKQQGGGGYNRASKIESTM